MRKLNKKVAGESVTRGYLSEVLEKTLKEKDYVTKDWAYDMFERIDKRFDEIDKRFDEAEKQNFQNIQAIMEDNRHQTSIIVETIGARIERIERFVGLETL